MAEDASAKKFLVSNFMNYKMVDTRPVMEQYHEMLRILGWLVIYRIYKIARLYLKDDDAVNAEAFINKVLFFVNTTVTTRANRAGQKNSKNLLVFQVRVSKTLKGSTQTLKSVSSFGEDKGFLCSVTGQKKVQQIVQQEKVSNSGFDRVIILSDFGCQEICYRERFVPEAISVSHDRGHV
ncbi:hypothetical protein Tco_0879416 [Tanacetum coccineum]